jgi:hypothetical protein
MDCRNIPAKKGPKNKSTKSHLRDNQLASLIGGSSLAMQVVEDVDHSIDVVRNSTTPESLFNSEMKPTHPQDSSRFPSDSLIEFPSLIAGTCGSSLFP